MQPPLRNFRIGSVGHVLVHELDVPTVQTVLAAVRRDDRPRPVPGLIAVIRDGQEMAESAAVDADDVGWSLDACDVIGYESFDMRVVAGTCRGLTITAPPGTGTRPTPDRVRESVFNSLRSMDALDGMTVVDLFAGSGALGIEALSRGAASATFVESDAAACQVISANLAKCGLADRGRVVRGDATTWRPYGSTPTGLLLADPPYAFDGWTALLADWPAEWVVVESDRDIDLDERWEIVRCKTYGQTHVTVARRAAPLADHPGRGV